MNILSYPHGLHMVRKSTCQCRQFNYCNQICQVNRQNLKLYECCWHGFNIIQRLFSHVKLSYNCGLQQCVAVWEETAVNFVHKSFWCVVVLMTSIIYTLSTHFQTYIKLLHMCRLVLLASRLFFGPFTWVTCFIDFVCTQQLVYFRAEMTEHFTEVVACFSSGEQTHRWLSMFPKFNEFVCNVPLNEPFLKGAKSFSS